MSEDKQPVVFGGKPDAPFFIGWMNCVPAGLNTFLAIVAAALLAFFAGAALSLSASVNDPGDGRIIGGRTVVGVVEMSPYPLLRLPPDGDNPDPRAIVLSGTGKNGVHRWTEPLAGQVVEARGPMLQRGTIQMLQTGGRRIKAAEGADPFTPAAPVPLGRWRIAGEICDGKCYTGAMRPGRGLSHKACAVLCIVGGVPPVFVSAQPVEGGTFFLLADENGGPIATADFERFAAIYVELEGDLERRDDLLIFKVDLDAAKVL